MSQMGRGRGIAPVEKPCLAVFDPVQGSQRTEKQMFLDGLIKSCL